MQPFLFVFLGGGGGAVLRYSISLFVANFNIALWTGTLIANLIGCTLLFLGLKFNTFVDESMMLLLKIGLLGGLTTFSTFSMELVESLKQGLYSQALLIFLLNIVLGIAIGIGILR